MDERYKKEGTRGGRAGHARKIKDDLGKLIFVQLSRMQINRIQQHYYHQRGREISRNIVYIYIRWVLLCYYQWSFVNKLEVYLSLIDNWSINSQYALCPLFMNLTLQSACHPFKFCRWIWTSRVCPGKSWIWFQYWRLRDDIRLCNVAGFWRWPIGLLGRQISVPRTSDDRDQTGSPARRDHVINWLITGG